MRFTARVASCLLALVCGSVQAMFLQPELEPVDRLVKNAEAYAKAHPSDPAAAYSLARIHYLAFALRLNVVPCVPTRGDVPPQPAADFMVGLPVEMARRNRAVELAREELGLKEGMPTQDEQREKFWQAVTRHTEKLAKDGWTPPQLPTSDLLEHADRAAQTFRRAMELDGKNGLYPLGLGSLFMQVADWVESAKVENLPESLKGDLRAAARAQFLKAWNLAFPDESKAKWLPLEGLPGFVSHEAGRGFVRLCESTTPTAEEKAALPKVRGGLEKLEKLKHNMVTPLVLATRPVQRLDEMLARGTAVRFDLRGFGEAETWEWIKPDLGLLVWDPLDRRDVRSGRELFGHYTFRIFRENGYEALAALDDNQDGALTGWELTGLAVWFDRNGDGRSTPDEVIPVDQLGVERLDCRATAKDGIHPMNPRGVRFHDGRELPTWDWIPKPAEVAP